MKKLLSIAAVLIIGTGCTSSPNAGKYAYQTSMGYYNQPNTAEIESIQVQEGGSYSVEIKGPASVVRSAPIPTKSIIPRDPGVMNKVVDGITKLGIGYFVGDAFKSATATRTVMQPSPLVVQPEVIQIPAPILP